ncbi:MAG: hypothetical protein HY040_06000 [Planctomycetes bacterium]|nr:hypothetical protein [Planctomycetota bacterium]
MNKGYDNEEEYIEVVLTNIYISEKSPGASLAGDHGGFSKLQNPDAFLVNVQNVNLSPRLLIERFRQNQPSFYRRLAWAGTPQRPRFNPIRQYDDLWQSGQIQLH